MPTEVAFTLGYCLPCISPSIVVPGLMKLNDSGYGRKKNIAGTLIAAGTFDDILCIIIFSICKTISLYNAGFGTG
jgi:solute carrier family 9B (sodium/hydrogen exchanger), member 1/2